MEAKVIISKEATVTHISQVQGVGVFCGLDNDSVGLCSGMIMS